MESTETEATRLSNPVSSGDDLKGSGGAVIDPRIGRPWKKRPERWQKGRRWMRRQQGWGDGVEAKSGMTAAMAMAKRMGC